MLSSGHLVDAESVLVDLGNCSPHLRGVPFQEPESEVIHMRHPLHELPLVEDYGEGFRSRMVEWAA